MARGQIHIPGEIERLLLKSVTQQFAAALRGGRVKHDQQREKAKDPADLTARDSMIKEMISTADRLHRD
jgi:hypothetical protein